MDVIIICSKECLFSETTKSSVESCIQELNNSEDCQINLSTRCYDLREIEHQNVATQVRKSKVQIVIVTQKFISEVQHLMHRTSSCYLHLKRVLNTKGVIAILTGVTLDEVNGTSIEGKLFPYLNRWTIIERPKTKKPDPEFMKTFTEHLIRNYNMNIRHDKPKIKLPSSCVSSSRKNSQVSSRKESQSVLTDADSYDSGMTETWLNGIEENEMLNTKFEIKDNMLSIQILEELKPNDEIVVQIRREGRIHSSTISLIDILDEMIFNVPIANIFSEKLNDFVENWIQKFPDYKKYLDDQLEATISRYLDFNSFEIEQSSSDEETYFPTPMHFAVYYGLENTVFCLLEKGKGLEMCDVKNYFGKTPLALVKERGYDDTIGKMISDNEDYICLLQAIQYVNKFLTQPEETIVLNQDEIEIAPELKVNGRGSEELEKEIYNIFEDDAGLENGNEFDCEDQDEEPEHEMPDLPPKLPIKSRRINLENNYLELSDKPVKPIRHKTEPIKFVEKDGYIITSNTLQRLNPSPIRKESIEPVSSSDEDEEETEYNKPVPVSPYKSSSNKTPPQERLSPRPITVLRPSTVLDPLQKELIEIMKQVANNEITANEVKFILEEREKRKDVQENLKEGQKQLEKARQEYHEIQKAVRHTYNNDGKGSGLLDKIAGVFKQGRKKRSTTTEPLFHISLSTPPKLEDNHTNPFDFSTMDKQASTSPVASSPITRRRQAEERIQIRRPGTFILKNNSEFNGQTNTDSLDSGDYTIVGSNTSSSTTNDTNDFRFSEQSKSSSAERFSEAENVASSFPQDQQHLSRSEITEEPLSSTTTYEEMNGKYSTPPPRPPKKSFQKLRKLSEISEIITADPENGHKPPVPTPRKKVQKPEPGSVLDYQNYANSNN